MLATKSPCLRDEGTTRGNVANVFDLNRASVALSVLPVVPGLKVGQHACTQDSWSGSSRGVYCVLSSRKVAEEDAEDEAEERANVPSSMWKY